MNKKLLLFSRDPGGANTIIPLVEPLSKMGYNVSLFGKDMALTKYAEYRLSYDNIIEKINEVSLNNIKSFLEKNKPDCIISGTSADDFTEKYIWKAARELEIPTIAILDQWINYGIRFSNYNINEISLFERDKICSFLPNIICAMDEYAKKEMILDGIPEERIVVCGQPYFESLIKNKVEMNQKEKLIQKYGINDDEILIIFASEPITQAYGVDYFGYTQKTILNNLVIALKDLKENINKKIFLIIRPHPKEDEENYFEYEKNSDNNIKYVIDKESPARILLERANLVCGITSMFLIESVILNKPTLSIQIGLNRKDKFILNERGILKSILSLYELEEQILKIFSSNKNKMKNFKFIQDPISRIITLVEKLICLN